ncbi:MAG: acetyl-CoA carboxylase biotin carboxyl carrier protein [Isosphaeraceae bacterium]
MPEEPTEPIDESPDLRTIRQLVRLMQRYDLTAIDLGEGPGTIRLRRRGAAPLAGPAPAPAPVLMPAVSTAPSPAPLKVPAGLAIESPMVGTYFSASAPDAPPFVSVGTSVRADTTICVIEAMKVFTDIPAGLAGTITEVLVKNGQAVEFGQPLFRVDPA